ncbi:MAG TPA: hypothetical protein V6C69_13740 [Trichormus sp.]|jgi:hypothetical protein
MANCAYLLATNTKEPCDINSPAALVMRGANYIIPLLWFGCFRTLDVNRHNFYALGPDGRAIEFEALTLFCKRRVAIEAFEEFAGRLWASRCISLPVADHIKTLLTDLQCVDCYAFQLDCAELQLVVSQQEFDVWLSKGIEFSEKVSCGAWSNLLVLDEDKAESLAQLLEFAHIHRSRERNEDDFDCESDSRQQTYFGRSAVKTAKAVDTQKSTVLWECANWEHSLVGIAAE